MRKIKFTKHVTSALLTVCAAGVLLLTACGNTATDSTESVLADTEPVSGEETEETTQDTSIETQTDTEDAGTDSDTDVVTIDYSGYSLYWSDDFEGDTLDTESWNYELHDPGWVNNELQSYVESDETVYISDGVLVIDPKETVDADGNVSYTSGRINTQGKVDFTYGIVEASIKMPSGQGFLPAFWMMPTDENLYGQWPRCGEIDIAEVLGSDTKTSYGTVHYGNPHSESQGSYTLSSGDFSEEFHTYAVEWLPGEIRWYVDGILIHSENDWYTTTENLGTVTYPAPFDQPFYLILNTAVGGDWPGNPDETTDVNAATMEIEYVAIYRQDSYDENVTKPEKEVTYREADAEGNFIINGDFSEAEDLDDTENWEFLTALEGKGNAEISDNCIHITTDNAGTADYSIQLVSWDLPVKEGAEYKITFDARADEDREAKVAVTAPERSWIRYFTDTVFELTSDIQTYEYEFTMTEEGDAAARLEFNMGNLGSTADIYISNVRFEQLTEGGAVEESKTVLSDGNYVYNSKFQEGDNRLGYWDLSDCASAACEVTNLADGRRLKVELTEDLEIPFCISQSDLALTAGEYALSFDLSGTDGCSITYRANGQEFTEVLSGEGQTDHFLQTFTYTGEEEANFISFAFSKAGTYYLDNVRIVENAMIKNGSFSAGTTGYEIYVDSSAAAEYVVDSLSEDNAIDFTVTNTSDADWKIQLKQNNVELVKGKTYTLTFDAKCSIDRKIRAIMQGGEDKGWAVYSGENIVTLSSDYRTYSITFTMEQDTDEEAYLSICLGAVDGTKIDEQHRVCIDNISLTEEQ